MLLNLQQRCTQSPHVFAVHSLTTLSLSHRCDLSLYKSDGQGSYRDRQRVFGRFIVQEGGGILRRGPPADVHRPAVETVAAGLRCFAFALTVSSVLRQTKVLLLDTASFLELNVDGIRGLVAHGDVDAHAIPSQLGPEREEQAAKLPLKSLVEVEVDERVVDVGAFGEEGGENKALRSHVPVPFVENEEEGHNGVRRPGDHKTQADAEKHLEEEVTDHRILVHWKHFSAVAEA